MDMNQQLKQLEQFRTEGANKVFTMYLNTDPADPDQQGGKWKINFKKGMHNFEQYLQEDNNKEELKNFQLIKTKVEKYVHAHEPDLLKGIIVFATGDEEVWFADRVQMRLETTFSWQETPELGQFKRLKVAYPKSGIILVQQEEIKIIESELNRIENTTSYELDLDTDDWRQKKGPRKGNATKGAPGASNYQQDHFNARYEANKQRWYKKIAPQLDKQAKDWEKIYIVGEADPTNELKRQMNKSADEVIHKNMLDQDETKVLQEVFG